MNHRLTPQDRQFRDDFEACRLAPADFDHRAHVRLAYTYLVEEDDETASRSLREALRRYLDHHGIPPSKYHETMTRAWLLAVRHFMETSSDSPSSDAFIDANPTLLDSAIMLSHYSADLLFSEAARADFVEPDLEDIPSYRQPGDPPSAR